MCGIVGYTGKYDCVEILLEGLRRLEYRGYDSAGVAVYNASRPESFQLHKAKGYVANLSALVETQKPCGQCGIGHTRWATHGEPSDINAHPHLSQCGRIAIVHNGIIENYFPLKTALQAQGVQFISDTDTEVVAQLLSTEYTGDMLTTLYRVVKMLEGSYALAILDLSQPGTIYCTRKNSPLVVGQGADGYYLASDTPAILSRTREVYFLENMDVAVLRPDAIAFYDECANPIQKPLTHIDWDVDAAEKGGYAHFMLKEIYQQPQVLADTLHKYVDPDGQVRQEFMPLSADAVRSIARIGIVGCGTALHAGLVGKALFEKLLRLPVTADIASEFRYKDPIVSPGDVYFVISQSGETADTIAAMEAIQQRGGIAIAICNVVGSTISRKADHVLYTLAGPEIAVASTKAYTTQMMVLYILALDFARKRGSLPLAAERELLEGLQQVPLAADQLLSDTLPVQHFAQRMAKSEHVFFIGRGLDEALSMEASLKLKEISYIHSEAYAAGELKHGTIALIEPGKLVVALSTQPPLADKMASNIKEVVVRGACTLGLAGEGCAAIRSACEELWTLPAISPLVAPMVAILPLQLFAYYIALYKGCEIDKPRNLAKSVTVE